VWGRRHGAMAHPCRQRSVSLCEPVRSSRALRSSPCSWPPAWIVWKFAFSGGASLSLPLRSEYCTANTSGEVTLTLDQMANAATISAVGIRRGVPERAVTVALATALQESKLTNLDGGDRDSVGLFQQASVAGLGFRRHRSPTRGTPPAGSTRRCCAFTTGNGSASPPPPQAVQHSAVPTGYAKWASDATILASALMGDKSAAVACNVSTTPTTRGPRALSDLTSILKQDWGTAALVHSETPDSLTLDVSGAQAGWQYAHWLVAHAVRPRVERVAVRQSRVDGGQGSGARSRARRRRPYHRWPRQR